MNAIAKVELYIHIVTGNNIQVRPDLRYEHENILFNRAYAKADEFLSKHRIQITYVRDGKQRNWRRYN